MYDNPVLGERHKDCMGKSPEKRTIHCEDRWTFGGSVACTAVL